MIEDCWICEEYCPVDFTIFQPGSSKALAISSGESWKPSAISKLDPHVMQISQFSVAPSGMVAIDLVLCIPQTVVTKGAKIAGPKISSFCYCRFESLRSTRWGQASDEICTSSRDRFKAWPGPKWRTARNKHWHEKDRSGQGGLKRRTNREPTSLKFQSSWCMSLRIHVWYRFSWQKHLFKISLVRPAWLSLAGSLGLGIALAALCARKSPKLTRSLCTSICKHSVWAKLVTSCRPWPAADCSDSQFCLSALSH